MFRSAGPIKIFDPPKLPKDATAGLKQFVESVTEYLRKMANVHNENYVRLERSTGEGGATIVIGGGGTMAAGGGTITTPGFHASGPMSVPVEGLPVTFPIDLGSAYTLFISCYRTFEGMVEAVSFQITERHSGGFKITPMYACTMEYAAFRKTF